MSEGIGVRAIINLNKMGFTDDEIIKAGNYVDNILRSSNTRYGFKPGGILGYANSNSGAASVLERARKGVSRDIVLPPGWAPGWRDYDKVGTSPAPTPPFISSPRTPLLCAAKGTGCD
jgi:hypothetical protein